MKQQITACQDALFALDAYAKILTEAVVALRSGDESDELMESFTRSYRVASPHSVIEELLNGVATSKSMKERRIRSLAKPDVLEAFLQFVGTSNHLDGVLEHVVDMQSPIFARVPPPYRYFKPSIEEVYAAFPSEIGGPLETPEIIDFQRYLETVENPWRK